ncbi:MAG: DUF2914 domain-containing protein [bacterium]|nr:DUF2914 domain-containing protein [bacterium]
MGFVWDSLTLSRIDLLYGNLVIIFYLTLAGASILVINLYDYNQNRYRVFSKLRTILPYLLQFTFGGLFSAFFIFYTRSASVWASWPFLLFLLFFLIGNELFRRQYQRLVFQINIYFLTLFSYAIFAVPILLGKIGAWIFIISGLISLVLIILIICLFFKLIPKKILQRKKLLMISISSVYIFFNILYFTNLIPPVPLALKASGIYHSIVKTAAGYSVTYEKPLWYQFYREFSYTFNWRPGASIVSYSAIFTPINIAVPIFHRWSFYDQEKNKWVELGRYGFPITGGRDNGYRGYTIKSGIMPGLWRVDVITERGQVLGRTKFKVVQTNTEPALEKKVK